MKNTSGTFCFLALTFLSLFTCMTEVTCDKTYIVDSPDIHHPEFPDTKRIEDGIKGANAYESLRALSTGSSNAFIQRRLFNTSVALTVPLFSFTLPQKASQGTTVDLANQAIFGLFSLLVVVLVFAVPVLFTGSRPSGLTGRSNVGMDESLDRLMAQDHIYNFMKTDLQNRIGLDTTKCLQKTICEAHRSPKKYGMLALPFRIFFVPPTDLARASASAFQLAAEDGQKRKDVVCADSYPCFFDILDLAQYLVDWWQYSLRNDNEI